MRPRRIYRSQIVSFAVGVKVREAVEELPSWIGAHSPIGSLDTCHNHLACLADSCKGSMRKFERYFRVRRSVSGCSMHGCHVDVLTIIASRRAGRGECRPAAQLRYDTIEKETKGELPCGRSI